MIESAEYWASHNRPALPDRELDDTLEELARVALSADKHREEAIAAHKVSAGLRAEVRHLTALVEAWRPVVRAAIDDDAESGSLMPVDRRRVPMCVALDALPEEHKP